MAAGAAAGQGLTGKLLAFWGFYKAYAGAARTGLSVRDLLAWVSLRLAGTVHMSHPLQAFNCVPAVAVPDPSLLVRRLLAGDNLYLGVLSVSSMHLTSSSCMLRSWHQPACRK